jgi:hypothetical protein
LKKNVLGVRNKILLGVKKAKISLQRPKSIGSFTFSMDGWMSVGGVALLHVRNNVLLGFKKAKIGLQSPKTEFWAQNQYGRVTHPLIGNFTWS